MHISVFSLFLVYGIKPILLVLVVLIKNLLKNIIATYDLYGNMTSRTDAMGNKTTYEYDRMDRCIKETNALGKSAIFVYDKNGRLKEETDREGRITVYGYDKAGRLVSRKTGLFETTYSYDAVGNLLTVTDASSMTCAYGVDNRLLTWNGKTGTHNDNGSSVWKQYLEGDR